MKTIEERLTTACDLYPMRDLCLVRGKGTTLWDETGRAYIDCVAGHGVANLGHCHPVITRAIEEQVNQLVTCSNVFFNNRRTQYAEALVVAAPPGLNRVFLCNSGAESIEAAMKFARMTTGKTGFISTMRGFHGRTFGAMSVTFNPKYRKNFQPQLPGCSYVPFNNIEALEKVINADTAAVILEPLQGEGGVIPGERSYFQAVRKLCDRSGALLILDEVQTGFGRTGTLFAVESLGVKPDMMTLAKAMGGGLPMGGVLCTQNIEISRGSHGTTFGGNPLTCAAGLAVLKVMNNGGFFENVQRKGQLFRSLLNEIKSDIVREVRGAGLMIGVELTQRVQPILIALMEKGVLALPAGSKVLRFLPPLTISDSEIRDVVSITRQVLVGY